MARRTRRGFLQAGALAGVGFWVAGGLEGGQNRPGPNDRLNIAFIGAGGRAGGNMGSQKDPQSGVQSENIVALCDVDETRYAGPAKRFPRAALYTDFRVMLEKQKDIEAVVVSTPDHTHAIASITAMRLGKHVYCEKPLTHSVWEARQMRLTAAKMKVATQMGNQGTSQDGLRTAAEIIRAGAIGDVREVHVWTDRPGTYWRQGHTAFNKGLPVPKTLHWDLWLGPAPERPYHTSLHPFRWRGWWDFGTGALGDMGCHTMNLPFMALRLGAPSAILAETDEAVNNISPPNGCRVTYEFPARGSMPACRLYWYEVRRPPMELLHGLKPSSSGSLFVGSKGTLLSGTSNGDRYLLLPREDFKGYEPPKPTLPRAGGRHHQEWIRACKGGAPAMSNFIDYAGPLTEMVLLGNVAMRVGKRIVWDADKLSCVGCPAADQYIRREYRKGWSI
jgi:predicted dehydrogenase